MRTSRLATAAGALLCVALVAACTSSEGPGWTYQPAASVTPAPSTAESGAPSPGTTPTTMPSASAAEPSGSAAASGEPSGSAPASGGTALTVVAQGIAFEQKELEAPADAAFQINFDNRDPAPHDVDIRDTAGATIVDTPVQGTAGQVTYDIQPLPAGEYQFICSVHPIPAMTGTLTVR